jgi:hypothetical protein
MRKIFYGTMVCLSAFGAMLNLSIVNEYTNGGVSLKMIEIMSMAYGAELPEVTITCSGGSSGQCYTEGDPHYSIGPLGFPMCETTCIFTGSQSDACVSGAPC